MKLGIVTAFLMSWDFEESLKFAAELGVTSVEVGACGISAKKFCDVDKVLADKGELNRWLDAYARYGMEIYSFAGHGAPLLPDKKLADEYKREFREVCKLAELVGVKRMTLVAGLPEGAEGDTCPVWITQQVEIPYFRDVFEWQWEKRLVPYWKEQGKIAADHGLTLCFEMQIGDMVHNPVKLKRLHDEVGPVIACNFDISHMWVQQIDPIAALYYLGDLVQNVHVKDTLIHDNNVRVQGMSDSTFPSNPEKRSWTWTLPGWGHDERTWREVLTTLRLIGYDGILSLEMECEYIDIEEGLRMSAAFLKPMIFKKGVGRRWWQAAEWRGLWEEKKEGKD